MEIGLHIADFTWPGGPPGIARANSRRVAVAAEDAGFARVSVMDHVWQIGAARAARARRCSRPTPRSGYLAARTSRVELLAWVTAVVYREPGPAGQVRQHPGRAVERPGVARASGLRGTSEEARGLGLPFPPTAERFERLEETLQICLQMWSDDEGPYDGKHYTLERTLNSPQPLRRPHPPILIGGGGRRRRCGWWRSTRRRATYSPGPTSPASSTCCAQHCADVGRDYDEIEKTVMVPFRPGPDGENVDQLLEQLRGSRRSGSRRRTAGCRGSRRSRRWRSSARGWCRRRRSSEVPTPECREAARGPALGLVAPRRPHPTVSPSSSGRRSSRG